jgi:hypothetical protein
MYLREIFYAIYKSSYIDILLNTLLAETILKGDAKCTNEKVILGQHAHITAVERTVLERIRFERKSKIHAKLWAQLRGELLDECFKRDYIKKSFFFGLRKTKMLEIDILENRDSFNKSIVKYIDTGDVNYIRPIISNIENIEYPSFKTNVSSRIGLYRDMLAMQRAAVDHYFGDTV